MSPYVRGPPSIWPEPDQVAIYSQDGEQWRLRYTLGVTHPGAWPRDLRGRLQVNGAQVTAFLPGLRCTGGSSPPSLDCHASDDPWHILSNSGGTPPTTLPPRTDLPPIVKQIPEKPPESFPKFDPLKPDETDFQLQQAVVLAQAMIRQKSASAR